MTPELAVARAVQWQRDWHAWINDSGSGISGGALLGRAANVIEDLASVLTVALADSALAAEIARREASHV